MLGHGAKEDEVVDALHEVQSEESPKDNKEVSSKRITMIKSVCKRLLFSKDVDDEVQEETIIDMWNVEEELDAKERDAPMEVVNGLRPHLREYRKRKAPFIADGLNFLVLANQILSKTGYCNFAREICPQAGPSEIHTLHLDTVPVYELFGSKDAPLFIFDGENQPITSVADAIHNKRAIFQAFFDIDKIEQTCISWGLTFDNRISITPHGLVRLQGILDMKETSIKSGYDERRCKGKMKGSIYDILPRDESGIRQALDSAVEELCNWRNARLTLKTAKLRR